MGRVAHFQAKRKSRRTQFYFALKCTTCSMFTCPLSTSVPTVIIAILNTKTHWLCNLSVLSLALWRLRRPRGKKKQTNVMNSVPYRLLRIWFAWNWYPRLQIPFWQKYRCLPEVAGFSGESRLRRRYGRFRPVRFTTLKHWQIPKSFWSESPAALSRLRRLSSELSRRGGDPLLQWWMNEWWSALNQVKNQT